MPSQQGDFVTEQSRLASLYSAANLRCTYNQTHACRLGCRLLSGFQAESPIFASGVLEDEGNDVQGAGDVFRLMECPMSRIPAVMLPIVKIVQCFGATIQLDQTQDPAKITIDGNFLQWKGQKPLLGSSSTEAAHVWTVQGQEVQALNPQEEALKASAVPPHPSLSSLMHQTSSESLASLSQ